MELDSLQARLQHAWCKKTSYLPDEWTPSNPAWGQCAVTALIIQDYFGGDLQFCKINNIEHYWNKLPNGTVVDMTREQFGTVTSETAPEPQSREFVLSFPDTVRRYKLLKKRLRKPV
jgi:hypothetical protein